MNAPGECSGSNNRTLKDLVDDYFSQYAGRDHTRTYRLGWWVKRLGDRPAASITDDDVFDALEALMTQPARRYAGRDADGAKIYRARPGKRSPATVNRYQVALGALFTWAIRKRRVPKGTDNPCRKIERQPESAGVVRFLSDGERAHLLAACKASRWPRLYLLVLLAITTGARRGELMALRWKDVDLDRARAHVCTSKNGAPRTLPLVPAVVEELQRFQAKPDGLVFCSRLKPGVAFNFEPMWKSAKEEAKISNFRFHDLRHSCASCLAQAGASLLEIADVMGHRQLSVTRRYSHLTIATKASLVNRILGDIR